MHTDQAPHYLTFKRGDRVVYGTPGIIGTIIESAHPMLSSWKILPEHENATPITLPTAEFEALGEHNEPSKWRRSMREHDEAREEPDTSDTKQELLRAPDGEALIEQNENASIATARNHKIRLSQPKLNDEKSMEITQKIRVESRPDQSRHRRGSRCDDTCDSERM